MAGWRNPVTWENNLLRFIQTEKKKKIVVKRKKNTPVILQFRFVIFLLKRRKRKWNAKRACRTKREGANYNRVQSETSVRARSLLLFNQIHLQPRLMGTVVHQSVGGSSSAPRGSSLFHSHTTWHVLSQGQRSLDCSCWLVWRRYCNGGRPRPTTPPPPRGESMEVQVPACVCHWPRPQCQVPVLWLASQHGISPHLKHSREEKSHIFIPCCHIVVVFWFSVSV